MITIEKGMTNSTVFTLNERTTLGTASKYFIQIYSNQNHDNKLMWLNDDISTDTIRYNQYLIEETNSEDLNNQKITLEPTSYDYFVHQTTGATLSLDYSEGIVESGKLKVTGTSSQTFLFDEKPDEYTFI